jgi:DNA-directed RNA polymerase subunit RPC12/RpoP
MFRPQRLTHRVCHHVHMADESLAEQFIHSDLETDCPVCGYGVWIMYAEIVAQAAIRCPCCRTRIWFRDSEGSAQTAGAVIERQIEDLLKDLWR